MPPGSSQTGLGRLRGLTTRGRSFLASGVACLACGFLFDERDLLRLGVFLMVLPGLGLSALYRTRYRMSCTRRLEPARVPVGSTATVTLRLENLSRLPTGVLLGEDSLPYQLGNRPRFVLDRVEPLGTREVGYSVRCDARGRFEIGPLALRLTDPFGLAELTRSFTAMETLVVTPQVLPLPRVVLGGEWAGSGETRARSVGSAGEQDVAPREYREGDDLRRVHWRSTARYGELMVRREEQPWQARAGVLLDTRHAAHRGDGPDSSFEWAVTAAASISVQLSRGGYVLRFVDSTGDELAGDGAAEVEGQLLDGLAEVEPSRDTALSLGLDRLRRGGGEGLVIALLGRLTPGEAAAVARLRTGSAASVALLLDTASWAQDSGPDPASALATPLDTEFEASAALLRAAGWRVVPVTRGTVLPDVWPLAGARAARSGRAGSGAWSGAWLTAGSTAGRTR